MSTCAVLPITSRGHSVLLRFGPCAHSVLLRFLAPASYVRERPAHKDHPESFIVFVSKFVVRSSDAQAVVGEIHSPRNSICNETNTDLSRASGLDYLFDIVGRLSMVCMLTAQHVVHVMHV